MEYLCQCKLSALYICLPVLQNLTAYGMTVKAYASMYLGLKVLSQYTSL